MNPLSPEAEAKKTEHEQHKKTAKNKAIETARAIKGNHSFKAKRKNSEEKQKRKPSKEEGKLEEKRGKRAQKRRKKSNTRAREQQKTKEEAKRRLKTHESG